MSLSFKRTLRGAAGIAFNNVHPAASWYSVQSLSPLIYIYRWCSKLPWQPTFKLMHLCIFFFFFFAQHLFAQKLNQYKCCKTSRVHVLYSLAVQQTRQISHTGVTCPISLCTSKMARLPFFFSLSFLLASLYTLNCAESFDGGWEECECGVEEKRNWALTLIRRRASGKSMVLNTTGSVVKVNR